MTQRASTLDLPAVRWLRDLLWPGSVARGPGRRYGIVVWNGRPRYVVPIDQRRVVAAVLARVSTDTSAPRRIAQRAVAPAARAGLVQPLIRTRFSSGTLEGVPPLEDYLSEILGTGRLHVVVSIGPPRPNAKPVLQLLTDDGETTAFAKVGWNGLTRELVTHEASVLRRLAGRPSEHLETPRLLHLGTWHRLDVSVVSALAPDASSRFRRRDPSTDELLELSNIDGTSTRRLVASPYTAGLRARIEALDAARRSGYGAALQRIEAHAGDADLPFGTSHGDWTPWNMITLDDRLLVWDWERARPDMPALLDVCHYAFQREWLRRSRPASEASTVAAAHVGTHAPAFGLDDSLVDTVVALYLLELALRYAENAAAGTDELRGERHAVIEAELARFV